VALSISRGLRSRHHDSRVHVHLPKTGLPDFAILTISYVPEARCVELKSLKEYLNAYRNLGIFNENVVNRALRDLVACVEPRRMSVRGAFTPRGGIQTTVEARFSRESIGVPLTRSK